MTEQESNESLNDNSMNLAGEALKDSMEFINSGDIQFVPFLFLWNKEEEKQTCVLMSEEPFEMAKKLINKEKQSTTGYAMAWHGADIYEYNGEKYPAVFIEVSDINSLKASTIAFFYHIEEGGFKLIETAMVEQVDNPLKV